MRQVIGSRVHVMLACLFCVFAFTACGKSAVRQAVSPRQTPEATVAETASRGLVSYLQGTAEIVRQGEKIAVTTGTEILEGDKLSTAKNSRLEITWGGETSIRLEPDSRLQIDRLVISNIKTQARFALSRGVLIASVKRLGDAESFEVKTPLAYCGVRGTRFLVSASDASSTIAVNEGSVKVIAGGPPLDALIALADKKTAAQLALRTVVFFAPSVESGRQLTISKAQTNKAEREYAELNTALAGASDDTAEPASYRAVIGANEFSAAPENAYSARAKTLKLIEGTPSAIKSEYSVLFAERGTLPKAAAPRPTPHPAIRAVLPGLGADARGSIVQAGGLALVGDTANNLRAINTKGETLWKIFTAPAAADPVVFKGKIYIASKGAIAVYDGEKGELLTSIELNNKNLPAEAIRPLQTEEGLVAATDEGLMLIDPATDKATKQTELEAQCATSPVAYKAKLVALVSEGGAFQLVDAATRQITKSIQTEARGKKLSAIRNQGSLFFFTDNNGLAVIVDIEAGAVLWQKQLPGRITADGDLNQQAVYIPTSLGLVILNTATGEEMQTVAEANGPILLTKSRLYMCTGFGSLIVAEASPYRELATIALPFVGTCRPLIVGDNLWVAGQGGKMVRIDPALITGN
jgi:outer membrane protein assembly factor BamB